MKFFKNFYEGLKDLRLDTARRRKSLPARSRGVYLLQNSRSGNRWTKHQLIREGYQKNPAFYAACNIIAQTIADMPLYVRYESRGEFEHTNRHPILGTLEKDTSREELIASVVLYLIVTGESYLEFIKSGDRPLGFVCIPSHYVTPIQGDIYNPVKYYEVMGRKEVSLYPDEVVAILKPDLLHPFQGMGAGVPLQEVIDLNNEAVMWNKNVAMSGGLPPIVGRTPPHMEESEAQEIVDRFQDQSGARNSHRLKLIHNDIELQSLNTSPHDAEWNNAILSSMRMIFMSFGVSSSLMNDAANKTYNNVKDSRKALYTDACLPIAHHIYRAISRFLLPYYKDRPSIMVDEDSIEALQEEKGRQAERIVKLVHSGLYTRNEGRQELGKPVSADPKANELIISNHPSEPKTPNEQEDERGTITEA